MNKKYIAVFLLSSIGFFSGCGKEPQSIADGAKEVPPLKVEERASNALPSEYLGLWIANERSSNRCEAYYKSYEGGPSEITLNIDRTELSSFEYHCAFRKVEPIVNANAGEKSSAYVITGKCGHVDKADETFVLRIDKGVLQRDGQEGQFSRCNYSLADLEKPIGVRQAQQTLKADGQKAASQNAQNKIVTLEGLKLSQDGKGRINYTVKALNNLRENIIGYVCLAIKDKNGVDIKINTSEGTAFESKSTRELTGHLMIGMNQISSIDSASVNFSKFGCGDPALYEVVSNVISVSGPDMMPLVRSAPQPTPDPISNTRAERYARPLAPVVTVSPFEARQNCFDGCANTNNIIEKGWKQRDINFCIKQCAAIHQ